MNQFQPNMALIDSSLKNIGFDFKGEGNIGWFYFNRKRVHFICVSTLRFRPQDQITSFEKDILRENLLMENCRILFEMFLRNCLPTYQYFGFLKRIGKINETKDITYGYFGWIIQQLQARKKESIDGDFIGYSVDYKDKNRNSHCIIDWSFCKDLDNDKFWAKLHLKKNCLSDEMCLFGLERKEITKDEYVAYLRSRIPRTVRIEKLSRSEKRKNVEGQITITSCYKDLSFQAGAENLSSSGLKINLKILLMWKLLIYLR